MNYELRIKGKWKTHNSLFQILNSLKFLLFAVKISGESMWPRFVPGKRYLATNVLKLRVGDCVVFKNPHSTAQIFVKKIIQKRHESHIVAGENSESISSGKIGMVNRDLVLGKILTGYNMGAGRREASPKMITDPSFR